MNRLPPTRIVVLLLATVLVVGGGITFWAQTTSQATKARYEQLVTEVPDESELNRKVEQSQAKVDDYKAKLQHLEEGVPSMAYVPTLLSEIENMGKEHHVVVTAVRPIVDNKVQKSTDEKSSGDEKKAGYQEMSIDVTGRGSYGNVMQMIEALNKFPKIIAIQTVGLTPRRESADTAKANGQSSGIDLDATIRIKAYLFPVPNAGDQTSTGASS